MDLLQSARVVCRPLCLPLCLLVMGALPSFAGGGVPDGDFEDGLRGWRVVEDSRGYGNWEVQQGATVVEEGTGRPADRGQLAMGATVACRPGPASFAQSVLAVERELVVQGSSLAVDISGGFDLTSAGRFTTVVRALLYARVPGQAARRFVRRETLSGTTSLGECAAIVGVGVIPERTWRLDLAAAGFQVGDRVTFGIRIVLESAVEEGCEWIEYGLGLTLDDVRFEPPLDAASAETASATVGRLDALRPSARRLRARPRRSVR